jgi:hypothetical protein
MKRLLAFIVAFSFWGGAFADMVFADGPLVIVFHERPCTVPAAEAAIAAYGAHSVVQGATVTLRELKAAGCWALDVDGDYIIVDERGSGGVIFAKAVKVPRGTT